MFISQSIFNFSKNETTIPNAAITRLQRKKKKMNINISWKFYRHFSSKACYLYIFMVNTWSVWSELAFVQPSCIFLKLTNYQVRLNFMFQCHLQHPHLFPLAMRMTPLALCPTLHGKVTWFSNSSFVDQHHQCATGPQVHLSSCR